MDDNLITTLRHASEFFETIEFHFQSNPLKKGIMIDLKVFGDMYLHLCSPRSSVIWQKVQLAFFGLFQVKQVLSNPDTRET